jgi:hypothetical protein
MSAAAKQVEDEWGTTAEKPLYRFLGDLMDNEKLAEIRKIQRELLEPPFQRHVERLAKECDLDLNVFALATAAVVVWGDGTDYLNTVAGFLGRNPKLSTTTIGQRIFGAFDRYENR